MKNTTIILSILLASCCKAYCQEINKQVGKDSLKVEMPAQQILTEPANTSFKSARQPIEGFRDDVLPAEENPQVNPKAVEMKQEKPFFPTWNGGMMTGYHGSMMGTFSYTNNAGINAFQQWGDLSLMGGISASKGVYNGLGIVNAINTDLSLGYRLSDNVILHAFGGVGNAGFLSNSPNMINAYYGGYLTLLTNNQKWGMDMGARRVYNSTTGRWETIPIAMPYYNLNGTKLGVDVGGLLYGVLHDAVNQKNIKSGNYDPRKGPAIIAPPIEKMEMKPLETPKWAEKQNGSQF